MLRLPMLSPRLEAVAQCVRTGIRLLDVGSDHAKLPVVLVGRGVCGSAIASDIGQGPCASARRTIERHRMSDRIAVVQTDGLRDIDLAQVDDVVMAGMGGETVLRILNARPEVLCERIRLILQPQTDLPDVRAWLYGHGCRFEERLVAEGERLYHVFCAQFTGRLAAPTFAQIHLGEPEGPAGLVSTARSRQLRAVEAQIEGLRRGKTPDPARLGELLDIRALLREAAGGPPDQGGEEDVLQERGSV
ncbi:MAG: SAM-dependent methyltransferase [Clostridiales bacterium]|nr:SAM-dependent methyltransferase [Clostridiales bacterium]